MEKAERCLFAGHSVICDSSAEEKIEKYVKFLIINHNVRGFWVGNYGEFDRCSASVVRKLQRIYPCIKLELIVPYLKKEIIDYKEQYYKNYNDIIIANIPNSTPKRFSIIKTNEFMVDNSGFLICYIDHGWGGAVKTYEYAKKERVTNF